MQKTIIGNCQTWLVLRIAGSTARILSDYFGQAEYQEKQEGVHVGGESEQGSMQWQARRTLRNIILSSEIQHLPDLEGYLAVLLLIAWLFLPINTTILTSRF